MASWTYGLEGIKRNTGGLLFNVFFYGILASTIYSFLLFLASALVSLFTSSNRFALNFEAVSLADTLFSYMLIPISSLLFLTESESTVSIGVSQGELVENGLYTVIGWRHAAENMRGAICFAIALHFLAFIHNYITLRNRLTAKQ